jgi:hypothetical protein
MSTVTAICLVPEYKGPDMTPDHCSLSSSSLSVVSSEFDTYFSNYLSRNDLTSPGSREMMQAYFIRNSSHPSGLLQYCTRSPRTPPPLPLRPIAPPRFPDATKTSLAIMQPLIFVVRFNCSQNCRSFGICIHYQFCCGVKNCPDGLVCERCLGHTPVMVSIWANQ